MSTTPEQMKAWRDRQRDGLPAGIVYYCFDADDEVIYIGSTALPLEERLRLHRVKHARTGRSPWINDVVRTSTDAFDSYAAARTAEEVAVRALQPRGNVIWTTRDRPNVTWPERAKVSNRLSSRAQSRALSALKALHPDQYRELYESAKSELLEDEQGVAS